MIREIKKGQQDFSLPVFVPDPASTDGSGKTGLLAANLTVSGVRVETDNDVTVTDYTGSLNDLSALTDAHSDWGIKEISSTLAPGLYRLDIADALFTTGAWSSVVYVMITASGASATPLEFVLVDETSLAMKEINQSLNGAKVVIDRDLNTCKTYDTNGTDLLFTITRTTVGNVDTLTRS